MDQQTPPVANSARPLSISDFFRLNGIEKIVDQERILQLIHSKSPAILWNHVYLTEQEKILLGRMHGYAVEEPPPQQEAP